MGYPNKCVPAVPGVIRLSPGDRTLPAGAVHRSGGLLHFAKAKRKARAMTTNHLHVLALCPREEETGWTWLTVPRLSIFGNQTSSITEWDYGVLRGHAPDVAIQIARKAREIQGLDYRTGPAILVDMGSDRLRHMLEFLHYEKRMGDATIHFASNEATARINDGRLKTLGMHVHSELIDTATGFALYHLGQARKDMQIAHELWPYPPNGRP
jgi:hypothetical protein